MEATEKDSKVETTSKLDEQITTTNGDADLKTVDPKVTTDISNQNFPIMERKVSCPPPCSWYQPHVAAAREDMWGYISMSALVVVRSAGSCQWPDFQLLETSSSKFTSISFCQSSWDKLPVPDSPLVSGCEKGYLRLWNAKTNEVVQYHDGHKIPGLPQTSVVVQWSPRQENLIYGVDSNGNVSVWDLAKNDARMLNLGKGCMTCLAVSPFEDDIIAIGTKGGHVMIVNACGRGKILVKMRHDEEVYSVQWKPTGIWGALNLDNSNFEEPFLISSISSNKPSTIRVWDRKGQDVDMLRPVEKEEKKMSKNFLPVLWAVDTFAESQDDRRLMLVTCGRRGEIISWSESSSFADEIHSLHTNYTIFSVIQCGDVLWSLSHEPIIIGWNMRHSYVEAVIPTFKGVCSIQPSPTDHTRVALGGMDCAIRIIGMDAGYPEIAPSKVPTVTAKLKGKVTALAWHPMRENRLAFGTDEGALGIYDWKTDNKFVMTFDKRISGTIYTLDWGPKTYLKDPKFGLGATDSRHPDIDIQTGSKLNSDGSVAVAAEDNKHDQKLFLYACGGKTVHMINPTTHSSPLISVTHIISKSNLTENAQKKKNRITDDCTDIKWSPDYSYLAVGYNDGRIELYNAPHLKIRCWIKCHGRGIQFMAWRLSDFQPLTQSDSYWFATASTDGTARLFNLEYLFGPEFKQNPEAEVHQVISSALTLNGHDGLRVLALAWSRHDPDLIVTVSYDRTAIVWNAVTGERISRYTGHQHRLVGCMFHPSDPFKVITTSDELTTDFSVHFWDYRHHPYIDDVKRAARECALQVQKSDPVKVKCDKSDTSSSAVPESTKTATETADDRKLEKVVHVPIKKTTEEKHTTKKKRKQKSLLPLSPNALINTKFCLEDEVRYLIDKKPMPTPSTSTGTGSVATEKEELEQHDTASVVSTEGEAEQRPEAANHPSFHLELFGTPEECLHHMQVEREGHAHKKRWDSALFLSNWLAIKGDESIDEVVKLAIKNRQVNEMILHTASTHSPEIYEEATLAYIEQLISEEEYFKAAHYYTLLNKPEAAVELLKKKKLYREAVVISKCIMPPELVDQDLYDKWIDHALNVGNFELACKICCGIGRLEQGLSIIGMRNTPYAWKTALYLAMKINDLTKAESFGLKFMEDAIVKGNYDECFQIIEEFDVLKWMLPIIFVHGTFMDAANAVEQKELYNEKTSKAKDVILEKLNGKEILKDSSSYITKINGRLLLAIPQNAGEAQILISKQVALILLGDTSVKENITTVIESCMETSRQWIESKNPALASAIMESLAKLKP